MILRGGVRRSFRLAPFGAALLLGGCDLGVLDPKGPIGDANLQILVDSVAWPPGEYATMPTGQIYCDGRYIGQSVLPMINAVRFWRGFLPTGHQVTGLIVIHPTPDAGPAPTPPAPTSADLFWSRADEAVRDLGGRLPPGQQPVSLQALNALVAATSEEGNR